MDLSKVRNKIKPKIKAVHPRIVKNEVILLAAFISSFTVFMVLRTKINVIKTLTVHCKILEKASFLFVIEPKKYLMKGKIEITKHIK